MKARSQPDRKDPLAASSEDFVLLLDEVAGDVAEIERHLRANDSQTWRRLYVRSTFAAFEAILAYMKTDIQISRRHDYLPLSQTQLKKLNEFYTFTDETGKRRRQIHRPPFLENMRFTFRLFASSSYVFDQIHFTSLGYKALERSVIIRNRITHPKKQRHMFVSDRELKDARAALEWFMETVINLHQEGLRSIQEQLQGLMKASRRLKRAERMKGKNVQNNFT